jgi:hypothetical protein
MFLQNVAIHKFMLHYNPKTNTDIFHSILLHIKNCCFWDDMPYTFLVKFCCYFCILIFASNIQFFNVCYEIFVQSTVGDYRHEYFVKLLVDLSYIPGCLSISVSMIITVLWAFLSREIKLR